MGDDVDRAEDAKLAALLQQAPRHARASAEARARVAAAVEREWRAGLAAGESAAPRSRSRWPLALAASVVAALGGLFAWRSSVPDTAAPVAPVAAVLRVLGGVSTQSSESTTPVALQAGARLVAGTRIVSDADGLATLDWGRGLSVRLADATRIRVDAPDHLTLEQGTVYVDADPAAVPAALVVATRHGDVRHVGTQYLVSSDAAGATPGLAVAVREGEVAIAPGSTAAGAATALTARAGEYLELRADAAPVRGTVTPDDARWQWLQRAPAPFALEGRTLGEFLRWYQRETGRRVALAGDAARIRSIVLHGSIDDLAPDDALAAVAASIDFVLLRSEQGLSLRAR